jgi:hypothetical protein
MAPRRRSKRRSSRITGRCGGVSEETGSPCLTSWDSTMSEELWRSGGGRFVCEMTADRPPGRGP